MSKCEGSLIELLPCPFCGGKAVEAEPLNKRDCVRIRCMNWCCSRETGDNSDGFVEAAELWNTRVHQTPDRLLEKLLWARRVTGLAAQVPAEEYNAGLNKAIAIVKEHFKGSTQAMEEKEQ